MEMEKVKERVEGIEALYKEILETLGSAFNLKPSNDLDTEKKSFSVSGYGFEAYLAIRFGVEGGHSQITLSFREPDGTYQRLIIESTGRSYHSIDSVESKVLDPSEAVLFIDRWSEILYSIVFKNYEIFRAASEAFLAKKTSYADLRRAVKG